jgi:CDP-glycerol glycerophosphotransferase
MYGLMRELVTKPEYTGYSVFFTVTRENQDEFRQRLERRGLAPMLVARGTRQYLHALATCEYLFTDNTFPVYMVKRSGQFLLNTWHGIPLKALGRSEKTDLTRCGNVQRNFALSDVVLFPNQDMERRIVRDYMLEGLCSPRVIRCGYPRNEAFATTRRKTDGVRRYAWLPTFRGVGEDRGREPTWLVPALEELDACLNDDERLLLKLHVVQRDSIDLGRFRHIVPMPTNEELYEVLAQCDGLLTDYSSVMFDFPLGGHKVVLWAPDCDEYVLERGTYQRMEDLPFPVVSSVADAVRELRSQKTYDDSELLRQCWPQETVGASAMVLRTVLDESKTSTLSERQPYQSAQTLVYSELGGDLAVLGAYLESLEVDGPVRLAFPWACGVGREGFLSSLPGSVELTPLAGPLLCSAGERIALSLSGKVRIAAFLRAVNTVYALERARLFGNVTFAAVVVHDGGDRRWSEFFRWMQREGERSRA